MFKREDKRLLEQLVWRTLTKDKKNEYGMDVIQAVIHAFEELEKILKESEVKK